MTNIEEQTPIFATKLLRFGKGLIVTGLLVIFASAFFLSVPGLASGARISGAIILVLGCLVNLLGLILGAKAKSHAA